MKRAVSVTMIGGLALAALATSPSAWALYKVVGPDGRVTYTDRAPTDRPTQAIKANGARVDADSLPTQLRPAAQRYPVTLFSSKDCQPCDAGRQLLKTRGVPFTEKTVNGNPDLQALRKQEGTDQLPILRIGTKQLLGFEGAEWGSYLDAAGYPGRSVLPANYQWPAPSPLVPPPAKQDANTSDTAASGASGSQTAPAGNAPSGFRF